jgi:ABC-2 type transport system ATP-binding protein
MSMADVVIEAQGLRKRFGAIEALRGLDLAVPAGSIYGLLGRNGAGKTTTVKTLMGMIRPTAGELRVLGHRPGDADGVAIRQRIGHVGEDRAAWPAMTAAQVLMVSRSLFPTWQVDAEQRYLDRFEIPSHQRIGRFSKGARSAFALVLALSRGADLLLLDEPTEGLDPAMSERALQALVGAVADRPGLTVLLSSHQLVDVERIADCVGILDRGRLVFEASLDDLKASCRRVIMAFDGGAPDALRRMAGVTQVRSEGRMASMLVTHHVAELIARAGELGAREIDVTAVTLKDIFLDAVETPDASPGRGPGLDA